MVSGVNASAADANVWRVGTLAGDSMTFATEGVKHVQVALRLLIAEAMSVVRPSSEGTHTTAPMLKAVKISWMKV